MVNGYDGSVRIDTRIDSKGFNQGISGIVASLSKVAAAVGLAFGAGQVIAFGKSAVDAASQMSNALVGLQSVLTGQKKSFSEAKTFIDSYIADGLIPATNAVAAYKNLATRGFSTTEIEKLMLVMKDSAAFNRQAVFSMGEAVQKATEGLRNENSLLTDSVGVQKNVAKMWETYAKSIGKATTALTLAEKRQAEINGFTEEAKFFMGDAAKVAQTYSGKVAGMSASFLNFRVALGNAIIPAIAAIIPYVTQLINWLTTLANTFGQVMAAIFGKQVVDTSKKAADEQEKLADATAKTEKAAKGSLAAFDEINVLSQQTAEGAAAAIPATEAPIEPKIPEEIPSGIMAQVEEFKARILEILTPVGEAFVRLYEALKPLGMTIWEGLKWAWENVLKPLGLWVIEKAAPVFLDLIAAGALVLNEALIALKPLGTWLWENLLKPIAEWTGQAFLDALKWITDRLNDLAVWIRKNPDEFMEIFGEALLSLLGPIGTLIGQWDEFKVAVEAAWAWMTDIWGNAGEWINENLVVPVKEGFAQLWQGIRDVWAGVSLWFSENVTGPVSEWFKTAWENIKEAAAGAWQGVQNLWNGAGAWFTVNIVDPIRSAFETILNWLPNAWKTAFDGVVGFAKSAVNTVIYFINAMIQAIARGINSAIDALNTLSVTIPDWVPGLGGQTWGLSLPYVPVPQIPRLATGAVVPAHSNMLAMVGEGSQTEIVAPEETIRRLIREELGIQQVQVNVEFTGSMAELARVLRPAIESETKRVGGTLISGVMA